MKTDIQIVPYGELLSPLSSSRSRGLGKHALISTPLHRMSRGRRSVVITFSRDLDQSFIELFRAKATAHTKLLILNEGTSADTLLSRIMELPVRTPQRLCVLDSSSGCGKTYSVPFLLALLRRLASGLAADESHERILSAKIENGVLCVISSNFDRLNVPVAEIPAFRKRKSESSNIHDFEIDEDGAFLYWPKLDVHLGWRQLQQLVNPEAALKASQKRGDFNKRYGKAVQVLRQKAGLAGHDITGLSEKQLGRIENGECRLTSNAIETLARAHKLAPNDYMKQLARALETRKPSLKEK